MSYNRKWSKMEDAAIIAHADRTGTWPGWARILPIRNAHAINLRRTHLGITNGKAEHKVTDWTDEQRTQLLRDVRLTCEKVGHDPFECMAELHRIMAASARGRGY